MARRTESARSNFELSAGMAGSVKSRVIFIDGVDSNLEEINSRSMFTGSSLEAMAFGLEDLADAIKDVFDKLEQIDRKIS
jgi:hypothetical protein